MLDYRVLLNEKKWHLMNYQIKFKGELQEGAILEDVMLKFANLVKTTPDKVAIFFDGQSHILKQDMSKETAEQYMLALQATGMMLHLIRQAGLNTLESPQPTKTLLEKSNSLGLAQDFGAQATLQYDLYFTGSVMPGFTRDEAIINFAQLSHQSKQQIQPLFDGENHCLKKNISYDAALEYSAKLGDIGLFIDMIASAPKVSNKSNFEQLLTEQHEMLTLATPIRSSDELAETLKQRHEERQLGYMAMTQADNSQTTAHNETRVEQDSFSNSFADDYVDNYDNSIQKKMQDTAGVLYEEGGDYCDVSVFDTEARIGRSYYWNLILIFFGMGLGVSLVQLLFFVQGNFVWALILGFIYRLVMIKFLYGVVARRLHDLNQPAWFGIPLVILAIANGYYIEAMIASCIAIILLGVIPGTRSDDSPFGPPSPPPTSLTNALAFTSIILICIILLSSVVIYKFQNNLSFSNITAVESNINQAAKIITQESEYQPYQGNNPIIKMQQKPREVQQKIDNMIQLQQGRLDQVKGE